MFRSPFLFLLLGLITAGIALSGVAGAWSPFVNILLVVFLALFVAGLVTNRPARV